jgi:putative ABC transport system permease protein
MRAEALRIVPVTLKNGVREKRVALTGLLGDAQLLQLLDRDFAPMRVPESGVVLTESLAEILGVGAGDKIRVEFKAGRRRDIDLPVGGIAQGYLGHGAYIGLDALNALMGDGRVVSGANLRIDANALPALYQAVKATPAVSSLALRAQSLTSFRATLAKNMNTMTTMYIALSAVIAFGVIYNSARIQLSERGRELASLRILGFTRREVTAILFGEIAILLIAALPLGWLAGYALAALVTHAMETDLYRIPLIIERATYAKAALTVVFAAAASALIVRRRIDRMDLVAVLKTRE